MLSPKLVLFFLSYYAACPCFALFRREAEDLEEIKRVGDVLRRLNGSDPLCKLENFGTDWGTHTLCAEHLHRRSCHFLSFGISNDWSFDTHLSKINCSGLALDPSVHLPSLLTPGVLFLKIGANSLGPVDWQSVSVPLLRRWYNHRLSALKMDCEGCEYSLSVDVSADDPLFFHHIYQLNIELHLPRSFMASDEHVYKLGRLFRQLRSAGHNLAHYDGGSCSPSDEALGCLPLFNNTGFPCLPGCVSLLFSRMRT